MGRFGRVFCSLVFLALVGGLAASPAAGQAVSQISFDEPHDGTTWHRGDVIRARIVPSLTIPGRPSLGRSCSWSSATRPMRSKAASTRTAAGPSSTTRLQSDDAAAADEVRMASVSLAGIEVDLSGFTPTTGPYAVDGGSRGAPPVIDRVGLSSFFFVPADGVYRPGDEIIWFARFHKAVTAMGAPVLAQRIGEEMREAGHRPDYDAQALPGTVYFAYTVQAGDCDMDGVGIPADAISGGSISEADGNRAASTSHPMQDPARDLQADAVRMVACAAVPAVPVPWLALLASLLLAAGAHLVRQRRLA